MPPCPLLRPSRCRRLSESSSSPRLKDLRLKVRSEVSVCLVATNKERAGRPFKGMLFTGIMMTADGPRVLEYNARFGDPETQTMMMLLAPECDLAAILLACCAGTLDSVSIPILPGFACNVVVAAGGYPGSYPKGDTITLGPCPEGQLFLWSCCACGVILISWGVNNKRWP